jgi:cytosine/adenosine deaminase-related metal-dependent hydrolase
VLAALRDHAERTSTGVHMHLLETRHARDYGQRAFGETLVRHLDRLGFLGPHLTTAHCVWAEPEDLELLADRGVMVSHNLSSNLRLRSGRAPLRRMLEAGLAVGLGLDGMPLDGEPDLWSEMRLVQTVHAEPGVGGWMPAAEDLLELGSRNGHRVTLGGAAPDGIAAGQPADLVLLDLEAAGLAGPGAPSDPAAILGLARPKHVDTVLIGGRVVLRDGAFTEVDEAAVRRELESALEAWRAAPPVDRLWELRPYLARYYRGNDGLSS